MKHNLLLLSYLFITNSLSASIIHSVGVNDNVAEAPSAGVAITSWATVGVNGTATSYTSPSISGTVDGEAFTYTITVSSTATTPNLALNNGRLGDGGTFNAGNGATITVNVTSGDVTFDGFNAFAVASAGNSEGGVVNDTSYVKNVNGINGNGYFALGGSLPATEAGFVHTSVGTTNLRWVDFQFSANTPPPAGPPPPNFLFIIVDDMATYSVQRYRELEAAEHKADGNPYVMNTPNVDRLANEGMLFHQARIMGSSRSAVCTGSRTCIMTGQNTWNLDHGISKGGILPDAAAAEFTMPGVFNRGKRTGLPDLTYATYRTCKNGNSYGVANGEFTIRNDQSKRGNGSGSPDGTGSEWHADRGIEHIEHWRLNHEPNNKPFLMYLGFSHPHDPRWVREVPNLDLMGQDLTAKYFCVNNTSPGTIILNNNTPPLPANHLPINEADGANTANHPFHPFNNGDLNIRDEQSVSGVGKYRSEAVVRNEIARDAALMDWLDQQLGRVFAKLEDPNGDGDTSDSIMDNTYIVFTADHGIAIGRHGLMGKQNLYEHSWRIPYIVRGPGIQAGSRSNALVYLHDTFPTFLDLAGLDQPATIDADDGSSFKGVLLGDSIHHRDALYGIYVGGKAAGVSDVKTPGARAVTDGRFKLIKYDVDSNNTQVTQLFDLKTNPFELLPEHGVPNLADNVAYASIRQRLEEQLMVERVRFSDPYAYLGDRSLWRFEDGAGGTAAGTLDDRLPLSNDAASMSGNGGALPVFSSDVPNPTDYVVDEANTTSLDFEQNNENYLTVADAPSLDYGENPFTIEAWVKLESLPTGANTASTMPVVMKRLTSTIDDNIDYMFLASAGSYGDGSTYNRLAVVLGSTTIISTLSIPDNTNWHRISIALDPVSDTVRFTMDDQVDTQTSTAFGVSNDGPLVIGAHLDSAGNVSSSFDGLIDELSITDGFQAINELQPLLQRAEVVDFKVNDVQVINSGDDIQLTFSSSDTRLFTIQCSTSLEADSWKDVESFIPGATDASTTTVTLPTSSTENRMFYRVIMH